MKSRPRIARALIEAIPDAIARLDRNGVYLDIKASSNFQPVQPPPQLVGQRQQNVLPPAMAAKFMHYNAVARATGTLQIFEYGKLVDQEVRMREARIVPISPDEVSAILRDITARKQAEREKARLLNEVVQQRAQLRALTARLAEVQEAERKEVAIMARGLTPKRCPSPRLIPVGVYSICVNAPKRLAGIVPLSPSPVPVSR